MPDFVAYMVGAVVTLYLLIKVLLDRGFDVEVTSPIRRHYFITREEWPRLFWTLVVLLAALAIFLSVKSVLTFIEGTPGT